MMTLKILGGSLYMGAMLTILWVVATPEEIRAAPSLPNTPDSVVGQVVATTTAAPAENAGVAPKTTPALAPATKPSAQSPYSPSAVAKHASASDCWSIINGNVYDLTSWISRHPGGQQTILMICGKDGSAAFDGQHGGQRRPESELAGFYLAKATP